MIFSSYGPNMKSVDCELRSLNLFKHVINQPVDLVLLTPAEYN